LIPCIWIEVERGHLSPTDIQSITGSDPVYLSPITISELQFGVEMAKDLSIRTMRQKSVDILKKKPLLKIDEETGAIHGRLGAELKHKKRPFLPDHGSLDSIPSYSTQPDNSYK